MDHPALGVALGASYAPAIPTLCQTAGDCVGSFGSDVTVSLRARVFLPSLGSAVPRVDLGVGYEWLTTKLTDGGATSTRAYSGPLLGVLEACAPFHLGPHLTLGPLVGASLGVFTREALDTSAFARAASVNGRGAHGWITLGVRVGFEGR